MINAYDILKVLSNFISHKFDDTASSPITFDEEYIALNLFNCLTSIVETGSYIFDIETTLGHDDESNDPDVDKNLLKQHQCLNILTLIVILIINPPMTTKTMISGCERTIDWITWNAL